MSDKLLRAVALASCEMTDGDGFERTCTDGACWGTPTVTTPGSPIKFDSDCLTRARRSLEACHHAQLVAALTLARGRLGRLCECKASSGCFDANLRDQIDAALSLAKPDGGK